MGEICAYIIYSKTLDKFYVGACNDGLEKRILNHNSKFYGNKAFTKIANDWEIYLEIKTIDFAHAVRIERKIKSMKSRTYIQNLKKYPDLLEKLILITS